MRFDPPLLPATFLRRYKRFFADIVLPDGRTAVAHVPNTGSLLGVARPSIPALVRPADRPGRKLPFGLVALRPGAAYVGVDTQLAMKLAREALECGVVPELGGFDALRPEVRYGPGDRSRIDFLLSWGGRRPAAAYVEVKNTTLVRPGPDGREAAFPDAPTARGRKHLEDLAWAVRRGHRAALVFTVQRADCDVFAPAADIDPAYAEGLARAMRAGVEVYALAPRRVGRHGLRLTRRLPVSVP